MVVTCVKGFKSPKLNLLCQIVSRIPCRHFVLCKVASKTKHFHSCRYFSIYWYKFVAVIILSEPPTIVAMSLTNRSIDELFCEYRYVATYNNITM